MNRYDDPDLALHRDQQVEDLRLHRHVERRHGLVEHHQVGVQASARAIATRWRWPPESSRGASRRGTSRASAT